MENISGNEATINDKNKEKTKQIIRDFILFYFTTCLVVLA